MGKYALSGVHETEMEGKMDTTLMTYMREQLAFVKLDFKRYLYTKLPWEARLVGLMGPRGVGKSTMILQHISEQT